MRRTVGLRERVGWVEKGKPGGLPGTENPDSIDGESWDGEIFELQETGVDENGSKYRRLDIVIDSGAFRSVLPPGIAPDYPTLDVPESELPKARTATGERVPVLGKKTISCCFNHGATKSLQFLVMQVMRPLASVSQMIANELSSGVRWS